MDMFSLQLESEWVGGQGVAGGSVSVVTTVWGVTSSTSQSTATPTTSSSTLPCSNPNMPAQPFNPHSKQPSFSSNMVNYPAKPNGWWAAKNDCNTYNGDQKPFDEQSTGECGFANSPGPTMGGGNTMGGPGGMGGAPGNMSGNVGGAGDALNAAAMVAAATATATATAVALRPERPEMQGQYNGQMGGMGSGFTGPGPGFPMQRPSTPNMNNPMNGMNNMMNNMISNMGGGMMNNMPMNTMQAMGPGMNKCMNMQPSMGMMYQRGMGPGSGPGGGRTGPYPNPAMFMAQKRAAAQGQFSQGPMGQMAQMNPQGMGMTGIRGGAGYPVQQPLPSQFPPGQGMRPAMRGCVPGGPPFSQGQFYNQQYNNFSNQAHWHV